MWLRRCAESYDAAGPAELPRLTSLPCMPSSRAAAVDGHHAPGAKYPGGLYGDLADDAAGPEHDHLLAGAHMKP